MYQERVDASTFVPAMHGVPGARATLRPSLSGVIPSTGFSISGPLRALFHEAVLWLPTFKKAPLRVLCDENISISAYRACRDSFAFATSIRREGRMGHTDQQVWDYACESGVDLILTRDKRNCEASDLTRIAIEAWRKALLDNDQPVDAFTRLPMLLHVSRDGMQAKRLRKLFKLASNGLEGLRERLASPVLTYGNDGFKAGINPFDLLREPLPKGRRVNISRGKKHALGYLLKIMDQGSLYDRESPHVLRHKRRVTKAVAIAMRGPDNGKVNGVKHLKKNRLP